MFACMAIKDDESGIDYRTRRKVMGVEQKVSRSSIGPMCQESAKEAIGLKSQRERRWGGVRKEIIKTNFVWEML